MKNINLHSIFRYLTGNDKFLSTVTEVDTSKLHGANKKKKQTGCNLMANIITEYNPLAPYDTQTYNFFPASVKEFLTPEHIRYGIKNIHEKNMRATNVSFLVSLNILLRPDTFEINLDEQMRNYYLLEEFITHRIHRNYRIDKTKNTKKTQDINKQTTTNLYDGKINQDVIQRVIDIFEINLVVFDFTKQDIYFYWTQGFKYPYLNLFKDIYCMSYIQGYYEPLFIPNKPISEEINRRLYLKILVNPIVISTPEIYLDIPTLLYIDTWKVDIVTYIKIIDKYYTEPKLIMEYEPKKYTGQKIEKQIVKI